MAHCHSIGLSALGLSGADANAILSVKRPVKEVDFGWVGDPVMVNIQTLSHFMNIDLTWGNNWDYLSQTGQWVIYHKVGQGDISCVFNRDGISNDLTDF